MAAVARVRAAVARVAAAAAARVAAAAAAMVVVVVEDLGKMSPSTRSAAVHNHWRNNGILPRLWWCTRSMPRTTVRGHLGQVYKYTQIRRNWSTC